MIENKCIIPSKCIVAVIQLIPSIVIKSLLLVGHLSEDDINLYRNIISKRFSAFVACITDTIHLLGITFILYL